VACRKPSLNGDILSFDPAAFPQSLHEASAPIDVVERCKAAAGRYTTSIVEIPDEPDFGGPLSVRRERSDRCSTEESYELASSHAEHSFLPEASGCSVRWHFSKVSTTEAADSFEAILRKPSFTDCLIEADRTQHEGQNSHERPTHGRSRRHGVAYDPNAKDSYSC
jgi:hypothetical protein